METKKSRVFVMLMAVAALLLVFGCLNPANPPAGNNSTSNTTPALAAKTGDTVSVDYVLRLDNGTVVDTSEFNVAQGAGILDTSRQYAPLQFQIGPASGLLPKFNDAIVGIKVGETKKFTLAAADGYGMPSAAYNISIARDSQIPRTYSVNLTDAQIQQLNITAGKNLSDKKYGWKMTVDSVDGNVITVTQNPVINQYFSNNGWPMYVKNISNDTLTLSLEPVVGASYQYPDQTTCPSGIAKVFAVNGTVVQADCNLPLAGQALNFEVTLRAILN